MNECRLCVLPIRDGQRAAQVVTGEAEDGEPHGFVSPEAVFHEWCWQAIEEAIEDGRIDPPEEGKP